MNEMPFYSNMIRGRQRKFFIIYNSASWLLYAAHIFKITMVLIIY